MEGFKKLIPKRCRCVRNGSVVEIDATELVPGDIVVLEDGMQIPADIRVITANEMKVDNSSLTGEPEPQDRGPELDIGADGQPVTQVMEAANVVFYTTLVNSGGGKGVVIGVGDETVFDRLHRQLAECGVTLVKARDEVESLGVTLDDDTVLPKIALLCVSPPLLLPPPKPLFLSAPLSVCLLS